MIDYAPQDSDKIFSNIKVVSNKDVGYGGRMDVAGYAM